MMTPAQNEALARIQDMMREHFDAGVCVVAADLEGDVKKCAIETVFNGRISEAVGLCDLGRDQLFGTLENYDGTKS